MASFFQAWEYVLYFLKRENHHSLQSPFAYTTYRGLMEHYKKYKKGDTEIELLRKNYKKNPHSIQIQDFGAGSRIFKGNERKITDIARYSCSSLKYSLLYQYFCSLTPSDTVVELGTCLGLNTAYLAKVTKGKVYTFEGSAELLLLAQKNLKTLHNIDYISGNMDQSLPSTLSKIEKIDFAHMDANHTYEATKNYFNQILPYLHDSSIVVIGDIHWSPGMKKAFNKIILMDQVKMSMDFYECGVLFFKQGLQKETYTLYF